MADNIALKNDDITTVATLRTDEISSVHYATTKISLGADGTHDGFVASGNPLPVSVSGSVAVTGTFYQATQPVSAASLPLPSGASTAAKQPALGVAGTASSDVISVQGITGMTALVVSDGSGSLTVDGTVTVTDGGSSISIDDGGSTISIDDGGGALTVDGSVTIADGGNSITVDGTVAVTDGGGSLTVDGSVTVGAGSAIIGRVGIDQTTPGTTNLVALAANQSVNTTQLGGNSISVGNGASGTGVQRVTLANDSTGVIATVGAVTAITNWGNLADNASFTDGTTRLSLGGYIFDEVAGTALTENDAAAARVDSKRAQVVVVEDATTRGQRMTVSASGGVGADIVSIGGTSVAAGNGASSAGALRVTVANDSTGILAGVTTVGTVTTVSTVTTVGTLTSITNWGNVADNAAFTDGTTRLSMGGYIFDEVAGTALTENDAAAARIDSKRAQIFTLEDATTRGQRLTVDANGAASANVTYLAGVAPNLGNGATSTGTLRVTMANDSTGVLATVSTVTTVGTVTNITNQGHLADNAAFTDGTTRVMMAGYIYDEVAGTALTENDAAAARINANRAVVGTIEDGSTRGRYATVSASNALKVDGSAVTQPVSLQAATTGGYSPYSLRSAATTNATVVKGTPGQLYSVDVSNINAAVRYLKVYDKASTPDPTSDTPVMRITIPAATTGGYFQQTFAGGISFANGIGFVLVTGSADNDTNAVSAGEHMVNMTYK